MLRWIAASMKWTRGIPCSTASPDWVSQPTRSTRSFSAICTSITPAARTHHNGDKRPVPTFPRARHIVGRLEWEDATSRAAELETAYPIENLTPLSDAGIVELIEGGSEIVPGLRARVTADTRGHMALMFESAGQSALFIGDICASSAHLHRMWNLSYDTYPLVTAPRETAIARRGRRRGLVGALATRSESRSGPPGPAPNTGFRACRSANVLELLGGAKPALSPREGGLPQLLFGTEREA